MAALVASEAFVMLVEIPAVTPRPGHAGDLLYGRHQVEVRVVDARDAPVAAGVNTLSPFSDMVYVLFEGSLWRRTGFAARETLAEEPDFHRMMESVRWGIYPLTTSKRRLNRFKDTKDRFTSATSADYAILCSDFARESEERAKRAIAIDGMLYHRGLPPFWILHKENQTAKLGSIFGFQWLNERLDARSYRDRDEFAQAVARRYGDQHQIENELVTAVDIPEEALNFNAGAGALEAAIWITASKLGYLTIPQVAADSVETIHGFMELLRLKAFAPDHDFMGSPLDLWPHEMDETEFLLHRPLVPRLRTMALDPMAHGLTAREENVIKQGLARAGYPLEPEIDPADAAALAI